MDAIHHNRNYSAADFERYHKGTMSLQERHQLEKDALEDPFLADALEGYAFTEKPGDDITFLQQSLEQRIDTKKIEAPFVKSSNRYGLLKVAAMLVLLAGLGWLVYRLTGFRQDEIATIPTQKTIKTETPVAPLSADSVATISSENSVPPVAKSTPKQTLTQPVQPTLQKNQPTAFSTPAPVAPAIDSTVLAGRMAGVNITDAFKKEKSATELTYKFNGRILDSNNKPVPNAMVMNPKTNQLSFADNTGNFSLVAPDTSVNVVVNSVGYETKNAKLTPSGNHDIRLQPAGNALNEVVVVGYGTQKKESAQARQNKNSRFTIEEAEPMQGWQSFDDYLEEHLKSPEELDIQTKGVVQLSFDVNKTGEPINIKVEKSLCDKCDAEAVRLLKEGPKWKKIRKNKKAKASIKF